MSNGLAALRGALGAESVFVEEAGEVEGATLEARVRPQGGEALASSLRVLSEHALPVLVRGGGTRLATANAPCRARVLLDTSGLIEAPEIDADEGVARFAAGATLASLHEALAGSGWELPLDPPGDASTLGGALAVAAQGPRFGSPRDVVLGLGVVLASGERIRCGGRVVKNVTGYDLAKLFVGSYGTLGVIEWAWLRLRPAPEATQLCIAPLETGAAADAAALEAARLPTVRAAALIDATLLGKAVGSAAQAVLVELAGDAAAVEQDAGRLAQEHAAAPAAAVLLAALRTAQGAGPLRVRIAALPTALPAAAAALRAGGGEVLAYPARGLLWGRFALDGANDERSAERALRAATEAARAAGSVGYLLEAAPLPLRSGREVFAGSTGTLALERAVKRQYDPAGILNPGRFVGGL